MTHAGQAHGRRGLSLQACLSRDDPAGPCETFRLPVIRPGIEIPRRFHRRSPVRCANGPVWHG